MNLSPLPIQKFFDNNGAPLVGGQLFTYIAGTSTKIATYKDSSGGPTNTNPIVLDFRGEGHIWLDQALTYKFVLAPAGDTDPPTRPIWTVDNITAAMSYAEIVALINLIVSQSFIGGALWPTSAQETTAGIVPDTHIYTYGDPRRDPYYINPNWLNFGDQPTYISATSFSVPGDVTARYPFASRVRILGTGGTGVNARVQACVFALGITTFTLAVDSGNVPNPAVMLSRAQAMNGDDPGVTRWDLNLNTGVFFWNVNNGALATAKVAIAVGQSGLGADSAMNIAVCGAAYGEYLTGSGVTGRQIVYHTGLNIPLLFGVADQLRLLISGTSSAIVFVGAEEGWRIRSPRVDDIGGAYGSFVEDDNTTRKGYFGFDFGGINNTMRMVNEKAASNIQISATANIWLSHAGGNTGAILTSAAADIGLFNGTGSPNGVVTANPSGIYQNKSGGAVTSVYFKESGTGTNTGWVAK